MYYYHLTHQKNVDSIMKKGIYSRHDVDSNNNISAIDLSYNSVQERRNYNIHDPRTNRKHSLKDFVPFFYRIETPMAYIYFKKQTPICFIRINSIQLDNYLQNKITPFVIYSDGNAASRETEFYTSHQEAMQSIDIDFINFKLDSWIEHEDGKRKFSAEILVYPYVPQELIDKILCTDLKTFEALEKSYGNKVEMTSIF